MHFNEYNHFSSTISEKFTVATGVRKDDALSPILFNITIGIGCQICTINGVTGFVYKIRIANSSSLVRRRYIRDISNRKTFKNQ